MAALLLPAAVRGVRLSRHRALRCDVLHPVGRGKANHVLCEALGLAVRVRVADGVWRSGLVTVVRMALSTVPVGPVRAVAALVALVDKPRGKAHQVATLCVRSARGGGGVAARSPIAVTLSQTTSTPRDDAQLSPGFVFAWA